MGGGREQKQRTHELEKKIQPSARDCNAWPAPERDPSFYRSLKKVVIFQRNWRSYSIVHGILMADPLVRSRGQGWRHATLSSWSSMDRWGGPQREVLCFEQ